MQNSGNCESKANNMNDESGKLMQTSEGPITEPWNLQVTRHAIQQHRNRSGMGTATDMQVANHLRGIVASGKEHVLKDKVSAVKQLLAHDCKPARYFKQHGAMVVVEGRFIVTSHNGCANNWRPLS